MLFLIGTYGVLFYHYVFPLTAIELQNRHRLLPHVLTQILLLGITVVTFVMYGKKNEKIAGAQVIE